LAVAGRVVVNPLAHTRFNQWLLAGRRVPLPRHLTLEITSFCNLRCRMCPKTNHAVNTAESQVMSREVFDRVVPFLRHIESLDLSGIWGEAFLHPDLYVDMLKKIKEQGSDVSRSATERSSPTISPASWWRTI